MTGLRIVTFLAVASCIAGAAMVPGSGTAYGAECKRKTAGFYLQDTDAAGARNLRSLQSITQSLTGMQGNAERGREVFIDRQRGDCLSCHKVSSLSSFASQGEIGSALDGIGSKYNEAQLRQVLVEPKAYFPDTMMPAYYRADAPAASVLTAAEIEDLVAFLRTLR